MPVRVFWSMCGAINRISAEHELSRLEVATIAQSGDANAHREFRAALMERIGTTIRRELPKSGKTDILALIKEI
jgi:hypothetical protein